MQSHDETADIPRDFEIGMGGASSVSCSLVESDCNNVTRAARQALAALEMGDDAVAQSFLEAGLMREVI